MITTKLQSLRTVMNKKQVAAIIVPTSDPHKSEYIADFYKSREWLTGFSGSAGTAVITQKHAGVWTDSRYFIQAEQELEAPFVLHKLKTRKPEYEEWLIENLDFGDTIGIDGELFSLAEIQAFIIKLKEKQIRIINIGDVFEEFWKNRPVLPKKSILIHDIKQCGESREFKIERLRNFLTQNNTPQTLITALDDIAWLLNIRGADIQYNPVAYAYCYISQNQSILFIDEQKINEETRIELKADKIIIQPYSAISSFLAEIKDYSKILIDAGNFNFALSDAIPLQCKTVAQPSIVSKFKTIKNDTEIANYKNAQIRDGVAMCQFLQWLDANVKNGGITEHVAALKSEYFRSQQENYMGLSFNPISAYQANAALPHYSQSENNCSKLELKGLYLIDSGAQFIDGTTDITRTVALGPVSKEQKTDFTLVLKGHIRLAQAKFPKGTQGFHLDTLARLDLWQKGKDFGHGTGHGIGFFLNVHEGPQGFSQASYGNAKTEFEPGMLTTNEPGIYHVGKYGIRIENVLLCVKDESHTENEFYKFETLTYCPIDKNLIDTNILSENEILWINNYHKKVFELLSPFTSNEVLPWLKDKTSAL